MSRIEIIKIIKIMEKIAVGVSRLRGVQKL